MRNRRRMFSKQFGFGRGRMDGTGPRAMMGMCLRHPQNNLAEYKQYLQEELKTVNSRLDQNPV